jgi:carbonic anhydrase/acetyltransferase-like protein (isoleucine patch superfamily)
VLQGQIAYPSCKLAIGQSPVIFQPSSMVRGLVKVAGGCMVVLAAYHPAQNARVYVIKYDDILRLVHVRCNIVERQTRNGRI